MAARVRSVPQARSKELFDPLRGAPGRSKELLKPPLGAPGRSKQLRRPLLGAPGHSKWLLQPLLSAPGAFGTPLRAPTRNHRDTRACFCATGRSKRRSKKLFKEAAQLH